MSATTREQTSVDWDLTISRAATGPLAEQKLLRTVELITQAQQFSRLRGDNGQVAELRLHLDVVYGLLDLL
jgi:hypothetical protein